MSRCQAYRDDLMLTELNWQSNPCKNTIIEAASLFTTYRQPVQLFYHAIRAYIRDNRRNQTATTGQYLALYYNYGGLQPNLHEHSNASRQAALAMFAEGYRVVFRSRRDFLGVPLRDFDIIAPQRAVYICPESAACA